MNEEILAMLEKRGIDDPDMASEESLLLALVDIRKEMTGLGLMGRNPEYPEDVIEFLNGWLEAQRQLGQKVSRFYKTTH